jgi:hypothetical protein
MLKYSKSASSKRTYSEEAPHVFDGSAGQAQLQELSFTLTVLLEIASPQKHWLKPTVNMIWTELTKTFQHHYTCNQNYRIDLNNIEVNSSCRELSSLLEVCESLHWYSSQDM